MNTGIEFSDEEIRAIAFFAAERKWRALNAQHEPKMHHSEVLMYQAEIRIADNITAKLDAWSRHRNSQNV